MVKPGGHYYCSHSLLFTQCLALNKTPDVENLLPACYSVQIKIKEIQVGKFFFQLFPKRRQSQLGTLVPWFVES